MSRKKIKRKSIRERSPKRTLLGVAWYREDQWDRLREIASDPDELENTYLEWLLVAEKSMRHLETTGLAFEKVDVDVEALLAWCQQENREVDGKARSEYASRTLQALKSIDSSSG